MAYQEENVRRIREQLLILGARSTEKRMFGGICFMVDDKMCCGTHTDKATGENFLFCRIGEEAYESALVREGCIPMEFTGKPMKGFVFVTERGYRNPVDLEYWLRLCLEYNPRAKSSKKK